MVEYPTYGFQDELQARSSAEVVIEATIMILITTTAIFGNIMVCWAVVRNKRLRTIPNIYITSLAISDIMMATIVMPGSVEVQITSKFTKSFTFCQIQGFFAFLSGLISLQIMTVMAINRYYRVAKPGRYRKYFTVKRTIASLVIVIFLAAFGASLHLVCKWAIHTVHYGKVICFTTFKTPDHEKGYITFLAICFFIIPACIISTCYLKVFKVVSNHKKSMFNSTKQPSDRQDGNADGTQENQQGKTTKLQMNVEEVKITKTLFVTVLGFAACWAPVAVTETVGSLSSHSFVIPRQVFLLCIYLSHGSSSINPFIYGALNRSFRKEFRSIFRLKRRNEIAGIHQAVVLRRVNEFLPEVQK